MARQFQLRRGTTAENNAFTGAEGEITFDTEKHTIRVHDGVTEGGFPVGGGSGSISNVDGKSITINSNDAIQTIGVINDNNPTTAIKTWKGTLDEYEALGSYSIDTQYIITDDEFDEDLRTTVYTKEETDRLVNRTNCIIEAPQHINLTLENNTLTLHAGSTVYIPNGFEDDGTTPRFIDYTLTEDYITSNIGAGSQDEILCISVLNDEVCERSDRLTYSGDTAPTAPSASDRYAFWYDTANNVIKRTTDYFQTWNVENISFPIAKIKMENNVITQIVETYPYIGYIGNAIYNLPGIKGLIPNGFNEDGSLKNTVYTLNKVTVWNNENPLTYLDDIAYIWIAGNNTDPTLKSNCIVRSSGGFQEVETLPLQGTNVGWSRYYVRSENKLYGWRNDIDSPYWFNDQMFLVGTMTLDRGTYKVNILNANTSFQALNKNDLNRLTTPIIEEYEDSYRTNCITKTPQNIQLEFDGENRKVTLKAGSVVYVPNGFEDDGTTKKFKKITIRNDVVRQDGTIAIEEDLYYIYIPSTNKLIDAHTNTSSSGTGAIPSYDTNPDSLYYKLDENKLYRIPNSTSSSTVESSLPIAIVHRNTASNKLILNQVFNSFGYIGHVLFALPGIEALRPSGRNNDGTLHSIKERNNEVLTFETIEESNTYNCIRFRGNFLGTGSLKYNAETNYNYINDYTSENQRMACYAGTYSKENNKITSIKPKLPMAQMDMNVLELMYPVGSIYIGTQAFCPMVYIISNSTWELVSSGKALWTGNGKSGSGTTTNANYANAPANTTIAAGLPDHTHKAKYRCNDASGYHADGTWVPHLWTSGYTYRGDTDAIKNASESNPGIYGNSTTVQPPAYVVNVWRRTA